MAKKMKNNLELILKVQNKRKYWLADKVSVRRSTISDLINGSEPRLRTAYKIARALNKTVYEIWPDLEEEESL